MAQPLIHTMIRVIDEERSLAFHGALGFSEIGRQRVGGDTATVIFLPLPGDRGRLELTVNDGRTEPYTHGEGFGAHRSDRRGHGRGARPARGGRDRAGEPPYSPYPGGPSICFVRDPDDYRIELLTRDPQDEFAAD